MKLDGIRESGNVDDRRRMSGGAKVVMVIGGFILVAFIMYFIMYAIIIFHSGGNLGDVFRQAQQMTTVDGVEQQIDRELTPEEEELAAFSKKVLASTEDVWTQVFRENGLGEYRAPTMVLYTGTVVTACQQPNGQVGPFYCSADEKLNIDLSFFSSMKRQLGANGDFAYAYVIAHEVGHHVQHLLKTLDKAQMSRTHKVDLNKLSVRIELQADFYAGVWGHYEQKMFGSLEDGDLQEAIQCAHQIGDNYLQEKAQGRRVPDSFTHGTSAQRMKWLKLGLQTGDLRQGDTFSKSESQL